VQQNKAVSRILYPKNDLDPNPLPGTDEECSSLHFFYNHTAPELAGFIDSTFWQRDLLQATHTHRAIRFAVVGLGTLHRRFVMNRQVFVPDISDQQVRSGVEQCNRAIQEIVKSSDANDIMTMMTFCVLFNYFAWLQGHFVIASEHLRSGLKLLAEIDAGKHPGKSLHPIGLESLRDILVSLDLQIRDIKSVDFLPYWASKPKGNSSELPQYFSTFEQANTIIARCYEENLSFLQAFDRGSEEERDGSKPDLKRLISKFNKAFQLLDEFVTRPTTFLTDQQLRSLPLLELSRKQMDIYIRIYGLQKKLGETVWDTLESEFAEMVDIAAKLLESTARNTPDYDHGSPSSSDSLHSDMTSERPIITFGRGPVSALWMVAYRCRNPILRRRAIALLLKYPRREGFWDGKLAGLVGTQCMILEETACLKEIREIRNDPSFTIKKASDIPDDYRVRSIDFSESDREVTEVKILTMAQYRRGEEGYTRSINWHSPYSAIASEIL
jgi:hypothetical protein